MHNCSRHNPLFFIGCHHFRWAHICSYLLPHPLPLPAGPSSPSKKRHRGNRYERSRKSRCGGRGRSASAAGAGASRRPSARPPGTRGLLNPPKTEPSWPRYGFRAPCPPKSLLQCRSPRTLTRCIFFGWLLADIEEQEGVGEELEGQGLCRHA